MIRLSLVGVRVEVPTNQPIVLLREIAGERQGSYALPRPLEAGPEILPPLVSPA